MDNVALIELTERKLELKIVQTRQGRYRVIEDVVNPYDLTKDLLKDCLFSPKSRADILKILGIYRYTVENFNVSKIVAFASNVVVKARNYRGLLDEIYTHTGINFNITGDDEVVKDIYNAVNAKVDMPKGVCVYIMGYSTYIIRYNRRSAFDTFVVPYGYINLTQKYSKIEDMIPELQGRFPIRVDLDNLTKEDFKKILSEPKNSITKQYASILKVDNIDLEFTEDALDEMAEMAFAENETSENIGARRLHTIMESLLEDISFNASGDHPLLKVKIDRKYVQNAFKETKKKFDLKKYIL